LFVATTLVASTARADVEAYVTAVPATAGSPAMVEARLRSAPRLPLSEIRLHDHDGVAVPASSLATFVQGTRTLSVALVIESNEAWMGNDDLESEDSAARMVGALKSLTVALDHLELARDLPPGSQGMIVTYDTGARVSLPLGPIANVNGRALGTQKHYYQRIGIDLVAGVEPAMTELEHSDAAHKLLIVIGSGNDTNDETAKSALLGLRKRAMSHHIETDAIIYKGVPSSPGAVVQALAPATRTVNSIDGIAATLASLVAHASDEYTVTFRGDQLAWDGKSHDLTISLGDAELDPTTVLLPAGPRTSMWAWLANGWVQLAIGVGLVLGIVGLLKLRGSRAGVMT
jgi:hypothetical protein